MISLFRKIVNKIVWEYRRYIKFGLRYVVFSKCCKLNCNLRELYFYQPVYLYKYGGTYSIDSGVQFGYDIGGRCKNGYIELQSRRPEACIHIGHKVAFNNNCTVMSCVGITIGDRCRIGSEVQIIDFDGHGIMPSQRHTVGRMKKIEIGENVWIGNRVTLLSGTVIGDNSVVAAGAVVKGEFPANVMIGGVPARIIKNIGDKNFDAT